MHVEFRRGISLENDNLQDRDEGGRIILKLILAILMNFFVVLNFTCFLFSVNFIVFFFLFYLFVLLSLS